MGQTVDHQLCIADGKHRTDQSTHHGRGKPFRQHLSAHLIRSEANSSEQSQITHSLLDPQSEQQPDQDHRCGNQKNTEPEKQSRKWRSTARRHQANGFDGLKL